MTDVTDHKAIVGQTDYPPKYAAFVQAVADRSDPYGAQDVIQNLSLGFSVGGSALTVNVRTRDGTTPNTNNPVAIAMRNATLTAGDFNVRKITAALSLTISSGSTLGHANGVAAHIYWYVIDNAGTLELAASSKYFGRHGIVSTTAEGGAGAADAHDVMYSATARSNVPFRLLARSLDSQTTAGTWTVLPSEVKLSPVSPSKFLFGVGTIGTTVAAGATAYLSVAGVSASEIVFRVSSRGRIFNLAANSSSVPGASESYTYTLRRSGGDTVLTCQTSGAASSGSQDLTRGVLVYPNDTISVKVVTTGGATVAAHLATFEGEFAQD